MNSNRLMTKAEKQVRQLLDEGSFMEIGEAVTARLTDFYSPEKAEPSDGVITGYGTVNGKPVYIFCQDEEVMGGTFGEMHGQKINNIYKLAMRSGSPIIGILNCNGFRIEEGLDGLNTFAGLYQMQAQAAEKIPQIMAVVGQCGGGMSIAANMADFVFVEKEQGRLFVSPKNTIDKSLEEDIQQADYSDAKLSCDALIESIRTLVTILPQKTGILPPVDACSDDLNRLCPEIIGQQGDGRRLLQTLSDDNFFFETKRNSGREIITGFLKIDGAVVGGIANNGKENETSRITAEGFDKTATFIALCNKFRIPILFVTDTEGFDTADEQEQYLPKAAGRMINALIKADVPKINLITGEIFGSIYSIMNSKGLGADYVFMWEDANVNIINPEQAVEILYPGMPAEEKAKKANLYRDTHCSAAALAGHGYVDKVIAPGDSRKYIAGALETFAGI